MQPQNLSGKFDKEEKEIIYEESEKKVDEIEKVQEVENIENPEKMVDENQPPQVEDTTNTGVREEKV